MRYCWRVDAIYTRDTLYLSLFLRVAANSKSGRLHKLTKLPGPFSKLPLYYHLLMLTLLLLLLLCYLRNLLTNSTDVYTHIQSLLARHMFTPIRNAKTFCVDRVLCRRRRPALYFPSLRRVRPPLVPTYIERITALAVAFSFRECRHTGQTLGFCYRIGETSSLAPL